MNKTLALLWLLAFPALAQDRFRALDPAEPIQFPRDHGAHLNSRIEWWYVTGHLTAETGERFGYQLTFFRAGLLDTPPGQRASKWTPLDLHMAHFAVTNVSKRGFQFAERTHRDGPGAAYARTEYLDVANEDWRLTDLGGKFALFARDGGTELTLLLEPQKPAVMHGANGLSKKGPEPDAVSKYVSFTRLAASGWLRKGKEVHRVSGTSWMDHEWGSGAFGKESAGWDWFSVQLKDGRDVMLYQIRGKEGIPTRFSSGTIVEKDGRSRPLQATDFSVTVLERWKSPASGGEYPSRWRVSIPGAGLEFTVVPLVANQELITNRSTRVTYWEGACEVAARSEPFNEIGSAYVELTGYAGKGSLGLLGGEAPR